MEKFVVVVGWVEHFVEKFGRFCFSARFPHCCRQNFRGKGETEMQVRTERDVLSPFLLQCICDITDMYVFIGFIFIFCFLDHIMLCLLGEVQNRFFE